MRTKPAGFAKRFGKMPRARIALQVGAHSIWVTSICSSLATRFCANVSELRAISRSDRKCDRSDAEKLARYARLDPGVLRPISHRSIAMHQSLTIIRARDVLVRTRTAMVNAVRGPGETMRVQIAEFFDALFR